MNRTGLTIKGNPSIRRTNLLFLLLVLVFGAPSPGCAADDAAINHLLHQVETSTLTFIRNGNEYSGKQAVGHMRRKRDHFAKKIQTGEDFIRLAGSKSELTGRPYLVRVSSAATVTCEAWMKAVLEEFRRRSR
jgi:hypothetical protein